MSNFQTDVVNTKAFADAADDTIDAAGRVKRAVDALTTAVHGLDVQGAYAERWRQAVATFDRTSQACKKNCDDLAEAVRSHGRNTDAANTAAAEQFGLAAKAAEGIA